MTLARSRSASQVRPRLAAGPDASGMRLVAARGLIDSASRPDEAAELRSWLETGALPGGPDLDSGLRWQIRISPARTINAAATKRSAPGRELECV